MTDLTSLNAQQRDAVLQSVNHNVVLLAGAGSGKTHTLVKRTEYLITDLNVSPANIMLVTFTNKAASEIMERIQKISPDANKMWIGTFHKICVRIIRMFGKNLGITNFTILDTKDARNIIKKILKAHGEETSADKVKFYQAGISELRNGLVGKEQALNDPNIEKKFAEIYVDYVDTCWKNKTFDFDDLIMYGMLLISTFPYVANWIHNNIKYIMVDECQDTNVAQFTLIKLLAGNNNTLLVGDTNQSIYAFRNAKPEYLENYANTTPNTLKLKLEQNYRSTKNIINAANEVIRYNNFGTKLTMFCDNEVGDYITLHKAMNSSNEAEWVAKEIISQTMYGKAYSDFAIIYRANFQSRYIEDAFARNGIPYVVFGSASFYSRKEVKDLLAYCKFVINPFDVNSFIRVMKTVHSVGEKTIDNIIQYSIDNVVNLHIALKDYTDSINGIVKNKLMQIVNLIEDNYESCEDLVENIFLNTEYRSRVAMINSDEAIESVEIMDEFLDMIKSMESKNDKPISEILDDVSLLSDAKGEEKSKKDAVKLMTAHSSKGLEFDTVFIIGAVEGIFPHSNAIATHERADIEEERRLFYVAMTRAEKKLYITVPNVKQDNMSFSAATTLSRFVKEIPEELMKEV